MEKFDEFVFRADLNSLENLKPSDLERVLCYFIPEVTKTKAEGLYLLKILYEMIVLIQKYLVMHRLNWKLIEGDNFVILRIVSDNVMQERVAMNIGTVSKQAVLITYEFEKTLW